MSEANTAYEATGQMKRARRNRSTTSREIVDYVRAQIFNGVIGAGERINQDQIADEFGVSRLPVREALIALESEGMVRSELHRGVYAIPISRADIEDHYTIYGHIQGLAASRAAQKLTDQDHEHLAELNSTLAGTSTDAERSDLDWQFHSKINRTGGSTRLLSILRQLGRSLPQSLYAMPPTASALAVVEHNAILESLKSQDSETTAKLVAAHTMREGAYLAKMLANAGVLSDSADSTTD